MLDRPRKWPLVTAPPLDVRADLGADPWSDLNATIVRRGTILRIALLPGGAVGGRGSAKLLAACKDRAAVVVETAWQLLHDAVRAIGAAPAGRREQEGTP